MKRNDELIREVRSVAAMARVMRCGSPDLDSNVKQIKLGEYLRV